MNPVFAPLNIVRPFDAVRHAGRSGAAGRDRIRHELSHRARRPGADREFLAESAPPTPAQGRV